MVTFEIQKGKEVLRLEAGKYIVIDKIDNCTPFGNFSNTIVKNESGKEFSIPTGNAQLLGLLD